MTLVETLARKRVTLGFIAALAAVALAQPSWASWRTGLAIALAGEAIRVWAAGHLEKSREVTRSGPYRVTRHPLYVGSSVIAVGIVVAAAGEGATPQAVALGALTAVYMVTTIAAAIRTEEAFLRRTFGETYDRYARSQADPMPRRFSATRALRNREYRAILGLAVGFALLAAKLLL